MLFRVGLKWGDRYQRKSYSMIIDPLWKASKYRKILGAKKSATRPAKKHKVRAAGRGTRIVLALREGLAIGFLRLSDKSSLEEDYLIIKAK